ncbi:MAG TPA: hypothetical protein VMG38_20915 [Trebonia sp.]|nr:hypothetical protein [Trebonia sp.]
MNVRNGLAACGIALLVTAGAAACGSSSSGSGGSGSNASGSSAGTSSGAAAGSSQPSWAKALGAGVQVIAPGATSPDNNTPADVVTGLVDAIKSKDYKGICQFYEPSQASECSSGMSQATPAELQAALGSLGTIKPSYTVIDGSQALVGATGRVCDPTTNKCSSNTDPAAVLDSGKTFSQLWKIAVGSSSDVYEPIPMVKINGKWYGDSSS